METHIPVMLSEVLAALDPQAGQKFIDGTLGAGGYTVALAQAVGPHGLVLATDLDNEAIQNIEQLKSNKHLVQITAVKSNFKDIKAVAKELFGDIVFDGIVMDLGLSSAQLADLGRGFSFRSQGPLNMAFDQDKQGKTEIIVNRYQESELAELIRNYGEERYAPRIARAIVARRREAKISTSAQLVEIIASAVPAVYRHDKRLHFATRTFQALRIATNDELHNLQAVLPDCLRLLAPGGRLALVSFHSLEDRIIKQFLAREAKDCLCPPKQLICHCGHQATLQIVTKKPLRPTEAEISSNPRARSAKLRVAIKL